MDNYTEASRTKLFNEFYTTLKNSNELSDFYSGYRLKYTKNILLYIIRKTMKDKFNIEVEE